MKKNFRGPYDTDPRTPFMLDNSTNNPTTPEPSTAGGNSTKGGISPNHKEEPPRRGGVPFGGVFGGITPPPVSPCVVSGGIVVKCGEMGKKATKAKRYNSRRKHELVIIEDTREQTPFTEWPEGVKVENGTLHTGDYSFKGWEKCVAIERKSLADFAGTMLNGYEANTERPKKRFNRELERMRHFDCRAVIVTATPEEVYEFKHHCGEEAHAALWNFALSVFANYATPVFFIKSEAMAARWIVDLARHYITAREKKNFTKADRSIQVLAEWAF